MSIDAQIAPSGRALVTVGKGTTIMVLSTVLLFLFSFIGRVAVARAFTVASWGDFSLGLALTGFLSIVAILGLHQAIARTLAFEQDPGVRRNIIRWGLLLTVSSAIISSATVYFLAGPLAQLFDAARSSQLTLVFQLFSVTVGFTLLSLFLAAIFQGFEDAGPNAVFNQVVNPGLFVLFVFLFLFLHLGFLGALLGYVLSNAIALLAFVWYTVRKLPQLLPRVGTVPMGFPSDLGKLSVALWGVTSLAFVTAYADTLILGVFWPAVTVGYYSSAMTLARLILVGSGALTFIYLPVASRLTRTQDFETIRTTYVTAARWTIAVTFPLFLIFAAVPSTSLGVVFGKNYEPGAVALSLLAWGAFISIMVGPVNACLAGMAYARTLLITSSVAALLNIAVSFALIPALGLIGAAIAWTFSRILFTAMGSRALWRSDRITPFRRTLTLPLVVSMAIGIPAFAILQLVHGPWWMIFPLFGIAAAIFPLAVLLTKTLDPGDLMVIRAIEKYLNIRLPALRNFFERFLVEEEHPLLPPVAK
jgi:O-antigen/teichoic acid export membrane protein